MIGTPESIFSEGMTISISSMKHGYFSVTRSLYGSLVDWPIHSGVRGSLSVCLLIASFWWSFSAAATVLVVPDRIEMDLSPVVDATGSAQALDVRYVLHHNRSGDAPFTLYFDTLEPGLSRVSDLVTALQVTDSLGEVPMAERGQSWRGSSRYQIWTSQRVSSGDLRVHYIVPVAKPLTSKRGPHIDLQAAGKGLSGAFVSFLLTPEIENTVINVAVRWHMPQGQSAVASIGVGDFTATLPADTLRANLFLAGPLQAFKPSNGEFEVYSLGLESSLLRGLGEWAGSAYDVESKAFKVKSAPYRFLIRSYEGGPIFSGRSADNSFMLYLPTGFDPQRLELHGLVAHEMIHSLMKDLDDELNDEGDWYTEGTADYFSRTLPFLAKLYSVTEYRDLVNEESAEYYTNARRSVNNKTLSKMMWAGRDAWTLPYARGALYLASLDAHLKARGSSMTALDLVNTMSERIRKGASATGKSWNSVLEENAGHWAVLEWHSMMNGTILYPPSNAFGDCLQGLRVPIRFFDLGFSQPSRLLAGEVISGITRGSSAERAGLREDDVLQASVDINPLVRQYNEQIKLDVKRNGLARTVIYDPHSTPAVGMTWALSKESGRHSKSGQACM